MNGAPREVLNGVSRENVEGPLRDLPRAKPEGNSKGDLQYSPEGLQGNSCNNGNMPFSHLKM